LNQSAAVLTKYYNNEAHSAKDYTMSIFNSKYQAIRIWGQHLGSFDYFIENEQAKAEAADAPLDALYKDGNTWVTIADLENKNNQRHVINKLMEYYTYFETPEKIESWEQSKPKVIVTK